MQIHELTQGSPEWHAHRGSYFNASDAPAMMGVSPYKTRAELVREYATGLGADVDAHKQRLFDAGHRYEALARPLAEKIIGEDLYPLVGTDGRYSASFDGLTLLETTGFEHKALNDALRAAFAEIDARTWMHDERGPCRLLPLVYRVQMEQQCMVSDAERILFMATRWADDDTLIEVHYCWYYPDLELRDRIVRGWAQFEADVAAYVPAEVVDGPVPVGRKPDQLPALRAIARGELVLDSNIKEWEKAALEFIKSVADHELVTDEDFENASEAAEWCESSKTTLLGVKAQLMSATGDVNTACATIERIAAELDKTRITFTKAIKEKKDAAKAKIVADARAAFTAHFQALAQRLGGPYMPPMSPDFAAAIKGLRSLKNMQAEVDGLLLRSKIDADVQADKIDANLKTIDAAGAPTLFPDKGALVLKAADDLAAVIAQRLAAEQRRQDAERERIRKEEAERVEREAAQQNCHAPESSVAPPAQAVDVTPQTPAAPGGGQGLVRSYTFGPATSASRTVADTRPPIKLGDICERLGFTLTAAFITDTLGIKPCGTDKRAVLFAAADYPLICEALIRHVTTKKEAR